MVAPKKSPYVLIDVDLADTIPTPGETHFESEGWGSRADVSCYQKTNTIEREPQLSPMAFGNHRYFFQIFYRYDFRRNRDIKRREDADRLTSSKQKTSRGNPR
jgi:hypothetical protein